MVRHSWIVVFLLGLGCNGSGVKPTNVALSARPQRLDFGVVEVGSRTSLRLSLENEGRVEASVDFSFGPSGPFVAPAPVKLPSGAFTEIEVAFAPVEAGEFNTDLVANTEAGALRIPISARSLKCAGEGCVASHFDKDAGICVSSAAPDGVSCEANCVSGGHCQGGICVGSEIDCDDQNACTADSCNADAGCIHSDVSGNCPATDEICRVAACEPLKGCITVPAPDGNACEDGCIVGVCSNGTCTGPMKSCDDGNACTADSCDADAGECAHQDVSDSCPAPADPCQVATCSPSSGCGEAPAEDETPCGPETCSDLPLCTAGVCIHYPAPAPGACGCDDSPPPPARLGVAMNHACLLDDDGGVVCWGDGRYGGGIGDGSFAVRTSPTPVAGLPPVVEISAHSWGGSLARTASGQLYFWGLRGSGPPPYRVPTPELVTDFSDAVMSSEGMTGCAVRADASVWCAGNNLYGRLGDGTQTSRGYWAPVIDLPPAKMVSLGQNRPAMALLADTSVRGWGLNLEGLLGTGKTSYIEFKPAVARTRDGHPLRGVAEVDVTGTISCVRTIRSEILCATDLRDSQGEPYFPDGAPGSSRWRWTVVQPNWQSEAWASRFVLAFRTAPSAAGPLQTALVNSARATPSCPTAG